MPVISAKRAFGELAKHAESMKNDEPQTAGAMSPGDAVAQGDLLIVALESVPRGAVATKAPAVQLAPGTTQGSRHCLESLADVTLYTVPDANVLDGPIIDARKSGCRINHPEHGDWILPAGVYAIVYQRAFADELRRVQD